jgi:LAO/AO transport system kinase
LRFERKGLYKHQWSPRSMRYVRLSVMQGVLKGERLSLSRAITLIESTLEAHRLEAEKLLDYVVRERSDRQSSRRRRGQTCLRLGIAGPPGAGKSTFIETLGKHLVNEKNLVSPAGP